jgi:hypothetical protein
MASVYRVFLAGFIAVMAPILVRADYPVVDDVKGLPYPELITVYKDDRDVHLYYFVPTTVAIQKHANGSLALGVQYWGLTGPDPAGRGAALTFTVVPAWDTTKIQNVYNAIKAQDPQARYAVPNLIGSKMEMAVNRSFVPKSQNTTLPSNTVGGTVDATQAFTIELSDIGARAFAQGVAPDSDVLTATYTYKFRGVGKRLHARITVYNRRVYDHFKATASASAWWGLVKASVTTDWQKLVKDGTIKLEILNGGVADTDEYMLEVFKNLVTAQVGGEGMFKPELKPNGVNTDTGGGLAGWGFSLSAGWEHLDEETSQVYEIDKQSLEDREFSTGMSFSAVCAAHPENFVDLTLIGKHCIDAAAFANVQKNEVGCQTTKLERLKDLLDRGLITQAVWEKKSAEAYDAPCYGPATLNTDSLMHPLMLFRADQFADKQLQKISKP